MLKSFGFDVVLIQKQAADDSHYDTAWTLQFLFGLLTGLLMLLAAPAIASYYEDPRLLGIARATAVLFVLNGAVNIGVVNFRKELNFQREFMFRGTIKFFSVIATIALALYFRSYWALVAGTLISAVLELGFSYYLSSYRPSFTLRAWREMMSFSAWLLLNSFVLFLNRRMSYLIIGKVLGVSSVGFLTLSNEFASLPNSELVAAVNRAAFPGYSKVAADKQALRKLYVDTLGAIVMVGIPGSVGVAVLAPVFVPVILGDKWLDTIPLIHLLGLAFALVSINTNAGYVFHAIGKPNVPAVANIFRASLLIGLLLLFLNHYGLIGAAIATGTVAMIMFPAYFLLLRWAIGLRLSQYLGAIYRPLIASVAMYCAVAQLAYQQPTVNLVPAASGNLWLLLEAIALGVGVFAGTVMLLWLILGRPDGVERTALNLLRTRLNSARN